MGFHAMTDTPIIWAFIKSPNLGNVFMYDQIWIFNDSLPLLISTGFLKYPLELKKKIELELKKKIS